MAVETVAAQSIQNHDERAVLSEYARGANLSQIESPRGREWVNGVIMAVAGMDRGRARAAVMAYDARMATPNGRREVEPAKPVGSGAKKATPPAFVEPKTNPQPEPQQERVKVDVTDVSQLLDAAERSGVARIQTKAAAIRKLVDELVTLMAASEQERALRVTIKTLTEQRDQAIRDLKELTGKPTALKANLSDSDDQRAIRAWALEQGLACNAHGRIPKRVVDAWRERGGTS